MTTLYLLTEQGCPLTCEPVDDLWEVSEMGDLVVASKALRAISTLGTIVTKETWLAVKARQRRVVTQPSAQHS